MHRNTPETLTESNAQEHPRDVLERWLMKSLRAKVHYSEHVRAHKFTLPGTPGVVFWANNSSLAWSLGGDPYTNQNFMILANNPNRGIGVELGVVKLKKIGKAWKLQKGHSAVAKAVKDYEPDGVTEAMTEAKYRTPPNLMIEARDPQSTLIRNIEGELDKIKSSNAYKGSRHLRKELKDVDKILGRILGRVGMGGHPGRGDVYEVAGAFEDMIPEMIGLADYEAARSKGEDPETHSDPSNDAAYNAAHRIAKALNDFVSRDRG